MVDQRPAEQLSGVSAQPIDASTPIAAAPAEPGRVEGLDGLRGLAALYVLLHHCWLFTFHGYPANTGPLWPGWLLYGHRGVVFFLTLSGFCPAIIPPRTTGGLAVRPGTPTAAPGGFCHRTGRRWHSAW